MTFNTIAEAFNHYRTAGPEEIERRAAEIQAVLETDPGADLDGLNTELEGLRQAQENLCQRSAAGAGQPWGLTPITGMGFERRGLDAGADVLASPEYRSAFFKTLLGQPLAPVETAAYQRARAEQRADAFASVTSAAAVLPTATLDEVISKARAMGGLLGACRGFRVPTRLAIPVGTPGGRAQWHTEGTQVDGEAPSVAGVTFDGYEILKVFSISAAARRMSISAFEGYLVDELAACVMACIADGLVNGTGSGQGTGLLSGVAWDESNRLTFADRASYADVVNTVGRLKRGYANGAAWAMDNATLYNQFYGMVDANQRPIFLPDPRGEGIGRLLGFPVVVDDYLPADTILFGNFQYMGYNLAEGIAIEVSRESSFKSGLIDYRAMAVADCKPIVGEAFVQLCRAEA